MARTFRLISAMVAVTALALSGCSTTAAFKSVPGAEIEQAQVTGFADIRTMGIGKADLMAMQPVRQDFRSSIVKSGAALSSMPASKPLSHLALSGGGSEGAYAAGLLTGWTVNGSRPTFSVVTGVSTGALAAPFAFLGSSHDATLREIYTQYGKSDLGRVQLVKAALGGSSLIDGSGLERLLAHYIDARVLAGIAVEHGRGRRLLVATTNVETERQVVWDMGAIASSRHPEALSLFRRVLLASAAIPGVFPPVLISVTVNGQPYEEMHADGGTVRQVFFPADAMRARAPTTLYVIRNGKLGPEWQPTEASALQIASRSLNTLIKNQARGDVERLQADAARTGMQFQLTAVPDAFTDTANEAFDVVYMRKLFNFGYRIGLGGAGWLKSVPP
jgi:predicted acylesterase/phospholipase RssA